jgi:SAM-dependent methyltransferase
MGVAAAPLQDLALFCCPACGAALAVDGAGLACSVGTHRFPVDDDIPLLFWPSEWDPGKPDVTEWIRAFYEETPFPDYEDFDSPASLAAKARQGRFAARLDEEIPPGARVLEVGCGTGQLTNFLSIANRTVFGADLCRNSLRLGRSFARENDLTRARFVQMNLFRPCFREGLFDLVVSNGVLHHTSDPFLGFRTISRLVRPGGHLLVGLYHRWGRLVTDLRRWIFRASGKRLTSLDPNLRRGAFRGPRRRAWFMDQYENPHESKHTLGEALGWLDRIGFELVRSLPRTRPFQPLRGDEALFEPESPGSPLERRLSELAMLASGSREGGFFVVIGRRPESPPAPQKSV